LLEIGLDLDQGVLGKGGYLHTASGGEWFLEELG